MDMGSFGEKAPANTVILARIQRGIGAAVLLNGQTIYHEDDDKGYSQEFTAKEVAKRQAKAVGVKVKQMTLKLSEIGGGEWNFDEVAAVAKG